MEATQIKKIAISVAHLLDAGISRMERLAMLAFVATRDGISAQDLAKCFNMTRSTVYSAMMAMSKAGLCRQEVRLEKMGKNKIHVGYWYIKPYGKDVLANFSNALQVK